jgi:hypothetical protein
LHARLFCRLSKEGGRIDKPGLEGIHEIGARDVFHRGPQLVEVEHVSNKGFGALLTQGLRSRVFLVNQRANPLSR